MAVSGAKGELHLMVGLNEDVVAPGREILCPTLKIFNKSRATFQSL